MRKFFAILAKKSISAWIAIWLATLFTGLYFVLVYGFFDAYLFFWLIIAVIPTFTYGLAVSFLIDFLMRKWNLSRLASLGFYSFFGLLFSCSFISSHLQFFGIIYCFLISLLFGAMENLFQTKPNLLRGRSLVLISSICILLFLFILFNIFSSSLFLISSICILLSLLIFFNIFTPPPND